MTDTEPTPIAPRRLHYRGDLRGQIEGQTLGPNLLGEHLTIVAVTYDADADRSTAHLRYAVTGEASA